MKFKIIISLIILSVISCAEENKKIPQVNEKMIEISKEEYYLSQINKALLNTNLDRLTFKETVLKPLDSLIIIDSKYKMLNLIANKTVKANEVIVFKQGFENFKKEYNKHLK